jgi:hypothetical protein
MKLVEHVAEVPLNGPRAEGQPRADLRIRQTIAGETTLGRAIGLARKETPLR